MKRRRIGKKREDRYRVQVRRDRPTHLAWAIALVITMLMVYLATLTPESSLRAQSVSASPRVTRELAFESIEMYMVSLCASESAEAARMLASGYTGRGAAGYIYQADGRWMVIGAAYDSEKDAERIARRLAENEELDTQVLCVNVPKVEMRITALDIQIDALEEADMLLRDQTRQLGSMALQLDRDEITPGTVCTLCAVASTRAGAASEIIRNIPGSAENDLCMALAERLDTLRGLLNTISSAVDADTASLSGMLRCAQTDTFLGQVEMQKALLDGGE